MPPATNSKFIGFPIELDLPIGKLPLCALLELSIVANLFPEPVAVDHFYSDIDFGSRVCIIF